MPLPNNDPSLPSEAAPIFADTDAGRGDHLRANNQKIWQNLQYLDDGENITDASAATPADVDQLGFWQIAGLIIKKVTFADFFLWLIGKIYALTGKTTPADADQLLITDSAASNVGKSLTLANMFLWIVSKVAALSSKATPVDADSVLLIDSEASNVGKRFTWANIKTAIFGAINGLTSKPTPVGADVIAIGDSAASFAGKKVTLAEAGIVKTYITAQASASRVTGTAPDAIGEYRSYLRDGRTYSETNGLPSTAPSASNGYRLYTSADYGTADSNNEPSRYEIFIGLNKEPVFEFYANPGRTGYISAYPFQRYAGYDVNGGFDVSYDPKTGIVQVFNPQYSGGNNFTGLTSAGDPVTADIYFDIKC